MLLHYLAKLKHTESHHCYTASAFCSAVKIGEHLAKLRTKNIVGHFWFTVYLSLESAAENVHFQNINFKGKHPSNNIHYCTLILC